MSGSDVESEIIKNLEDGAPLLLAMRYFMVITTTLVLYDHILTFDDEVKHIWKARKWWNKIIFVVNRYIVEATLAFTTYVTLELRPHLTDHASLIPVALVAILCIAVSHLMITLRVDALWDHRKTITYMMLVGFAVTYSIGVTFFIIGVVNLYEEISFFPPVNSCVAAHLSRSVNVVWVSMVFFDVFVFVLVLMNGLNRPYRETSEVVSNLKDDGIIFFAIILGDRAFNMIFALAAGTSKTFLFVYFTWGIFAIAVCRLILRVESTKVSQKPEATDLQGWIPNPQQFELKTPSEYSGRTISSGLIDLSSGRY